MNANEVTSQLQICILYVNLVYMYLDYLRAQGQQLTFNRQQLLPLLWWSVSACQKR